MLDSFSQVSAMQTRAEQQRHENMCVQEAYGHAAAAAAAAGDEKE